LALYEHDLQQCRPFVIQNNFYILLINSYLQKSESGGFSKEERYNRGFFIAWITAPPGSKDGVLSSRR